MPLHSSAHTTPCLQTAAAKLVVQRGSLTQAAHDTNDLQMGMWARAMPHPVVFSAASCLDNPGDHMLEPELSSLRAQQGQLQAASVSTGASSNPVTVAILLHSDEDHVDLPLRQGQA